MAEQWDIWADLELQNKLCNEKWQKEAQRIENILMMTKKAEREEVKENNIGLSYNTHNLHVVFANHALLLHCQLVMQLMLRVMIPSSFVVFVCEFLASMFYFILSKLKS